MCARAGMGELVPMQFCDYSIVRLWGVMFKVVTEVWL